MRQHQTTEAAASAVAIDLDQQTQDWHLTMWHPCPYSVSDSGSETTPCTGGRGTRNPDACLFCAGQAPDRLPDRIRNERTFDTVDIGSSLAENGDTPYRTCLTIKRKCIRSENELIEVVLRNVESLTMDNRRPYFSAGSRNRRR